jgi:hypothetical protein
VTEPILSTVDYERFRSLVQERSGLHFPERKRLDLASGVLRGLAESGHANLDEYYRVLRQTGTPAGRSAFEQLVNLLTIGETHFFRDQTQFSALEQHILPGLIAQRSPARGACACGAQAAPSGEEPYSLAMLAAGLLPDQAALAGHHPGDRHQQPGVAASRRSGLRRLVVPRRARAQRAVALLPARARPAVAPRYRLLDAVRQAVTLMPLHPSKTLTRRCTTTPWRWTSFCAATC